MNFPPTLSWLNAPAWLPLIHALMHTLWQGALAAGGLFLVLRLVPAHRARLRYGLSTTALGMVVLAGVGSWALLEPPRSSPVGATRGGHPPKTVIEHLPAGGVSPAVTFPSTPAGERPAIRATGVGPVVIDSGAPKTKTWVQWAVAGWLLGTFVGLLRTVKGTLGAGRLRRRCRDLADPRVLALAKELCTRLGLSQRVRFLVCDEIGVPSMLGIIYPAVLLPASLLTGVSTEQLRAILAHELAHIRRLDYLANLAQMLVEALLFFNPFIWWISRQMRLEREACCDEIAAGECQSPACYVEALVAVIERSRLTTDTAAPILAASGPDAHGGNTLERARRLLVPGYQPTFRVGWFSLAAVLVFSISALSGLWLATRAVAQTIQAPEAKAKSELPDAPSKPTPPESFVATVRTSEGAPADDDSATAYIYESSSPNSGGTGAFGINQPGLIVNHQKGRFTLRPKADSRTFTCAVIMQGYAATFAGPFAPPFKELENIHFTLQKGYAASVETVDEAGQSIAGARLEAYYPGPPQVALGEAKTDASGVAVLEHVGKMPLNIRAYVEGFQMDEIKNVRLDPAKPYRWTLKHGLRTAGIVTDRFHRPIAGAIVKLAGVRGALEVTNLGSDGALLLATADATGGFALTALRADCRYCFFVEAPGYSGVYVRDYNPTSGGLLVNLGPELVVRGKVIHIPDSAFFLDGVPLFYSQSFMYQDGGIGSAQRSLILHPKNGEADFSIGPFFMTQTGSMPGRPAPLDNGEVAIHVEKFPEIKISVEDLEGFAPLLKNPKFGITYDLAEKTPPVVTPDALRSQFAGKPSAVPPSVSASPAAELPDAKGPTATASPTPGSPAPAVLSGKDAALAPAPVPALPDDALAAAREGNAKQALSLLEASFKPKRFGEEDAARILDELIRARELRAFETLYDPWTHSSAEKWKLSDELLTGLIKDGRTDFLDALLARRFDLDRLTKAAVSADPATTAWITRRVAEVNKQRADIEALEKAAADNDLPAMQRLLDAGADVNGVGKDDNTPLIRAVSSNRLEAAQWLLDHGAQVDKPRLPSWNYTPLCLVNSVPMAELLKKYGADVHAKLYERDVSILTYVVDFAKADVVAWFLKQGLDANMIGDNQQNLLFGLKDGATAEVLLESGADPNRVDEFGHTPLTSAQSAEVVRALVRYGANLKPKLRDGETLLEYAVKNIHRSENTPQDDADRLEELLRQGAEFDPKGNGVRAMIQAAFSDRVGEVRAFLDHGVSPNAAYERQPGEYYTALSRAAVQAPKSLKLLLERGADPNAPFPAWSFSPLDSALAFGAFGNVDVLRQAGAKGLSDLSYYSARGDVAKVGELLDQHADPNEASPSGWTPLRYAIQHAHVEVARQLLDHGASVDQFDGWGFSPYLYFKLTQSMIEWDSNQARMQWHLSAQEAKTRLDAFQELFTQHPPNLGYRNAAGRTALHQAAWGGGSTVIGLILDRKHLRLDPDVLDGEGKTPLLLAALSPAAKNTEETITTGMDTPQQKTWNQQAFLADELLKAGARLDLVVVDGKTVGELALAAAREANNAQLVAVLTDALNGKPETGAASPTPSSPPGSPAPAASPDKDAASVPNPPPGGYALRNAAGEGRIEIVRELLDHGADINFQDEHGFTSLSWAAYCGHEDVCLLLLERGADGRIEDQDGRNAAWHAAAGPHSTEALTRMIKAGVPVTGKDKQGNTVLDYMMSWATPEVGDKGLSTKVFTVADSERNGESERQVVELLLAEGVDPNGAGSDVPLIRAMHHNHYAAARVLLAHGADPARKDKNGNTALYEFIGYSADRPLPLDLFKTLWQRSGSLNPEFTVEGVTPPRKTSLLEMVITGAGRDPLRRASFHEALKIMLDGGVTFAGVADPKAQALLQAAARGDLAAIQRSVGQGAPVNAADDGGWDALSLSTALGYIDCADWLVDHGADVNGCPRSPWNGPLPNAVSGGQADLVEKLLAKGATLDGVYNGLHTAALLKNTRIFDALLKAGADPKRKPMVTVSTGSETFTPPDAVTLYLCIREGQTDMARTLLDRGADAEPPHLEDGRNLAWWAVDYNRPEILQSLLDHGADPLVKDEHGDCALDLARKHHPKLVPMLEEAGKRKPAPATFPSPAPAP